MVPSGWEIKKLEELCCPDAPITYGVLKPGEFYQGGIPLLQIKDLRDGDVTTHDIHLISPKLDEEYKRSRILRNDILISLVGTIGRIAKYQSDEDANIHRNIGRIRSDDHEYLYHFLMSSHAQNVIGGSSSGSSQSALNLSSLRDMKIPVPPPAEQKKIAKILSVWDKAITTTEQLLANSQQQKKALMQKLLTGKVRFLKNVANKFEVSKGYSKSRLGPLPSDWSVETIKKHLWFQEGPGVRNFQFTESGVKLFNGTNIQFNNISLSKTTTHISEEEAFGAYKHFLVDAGDLLIACSGISVDRFDEKIAFVGEEHLPLCMNTSTMRFKTIDSNVVDIRYFQYFMQSNLFKNQIRRQATGSAQLNFGPSHVAKCFVVLPSFLEQKKIASLLSLVDGEVRAIQRKLDLLKDEKAALMQQLLTGKRRVIIN